MKVSLSILGIDFSQIQKEISFYESQNIQRIHIDVFDGCLVPTLTFGPRVIRSIIQSKTKRNLDIEVHLCVRKPEKWVDRLTSLNIDILHLPFECFSSLQHAKKCFQDFRKTGVSKIGLALNPETPVSDVENLLPFVEEVLIMTVAPGFGGLKMDVSLLSKIRSLKFLQPTLTVVVDGGVKEANAEICLRSGADVLVMGSQLTEVQRSQVGEILDRVHKLKQGGNFESLLDLPMKHVPFSRVRGSTMKAWTQLGGIVKETSIFKLKKRLCQVERGIGYVVSVGECSENWSVFRENPAKYVEAFVQQTRTAEKMLPETVLKIYRMAGQTTKPRSSATTKDGITPSFWGLNVNTPEDRKICPDRVIEGHSIACSMFSEIKLQDPDAYITHESLLLPWEISQTIESESGAHVNLSAHLLWVGNKTRQLDHAHVAYLSRVENPVGVKLDLSVGEQDFEDLCRSLNPNNESGKILFIVRAGNPSNRTKLEEYRRVVGSWLKVKQEKKLAGIFLCDPMHGNTKLAGTQKVRYVSDLVGEYSVLSSFMRSRNDRLSGIMCETSPFHDVSECLMEESDATSLRNYKSLCDPCLTSKQFEFLMESAAAHHRDRLDIGIIMAKKGSKGLAGKNRLILRKDPLYVEAWRDLSRQVDKAFVSSNDLEIQDECRKLGLPFVLREDSLALNGKYEDAVRFTVDCIQQQHSLSIKTVSVVMCVQPFRERGVVRNMLKKLKQDCFADSIVTVKPSAGNESWLLKKNQQTGALTCVFSNHDSSLEESRANDTFEIDNAVVCFKNDSLLRHSCSGGKLPWGYLGKRILSYEQKFMNNNLAVDINYEQDWEWAQFCLTFRDWQRKNRLKGLESKESGMISDFFDEEGLANRVTSGWFCNYPRAKLWGKARTLLIEECKPGEPENIEHGLKFFDTLLPGEILVVKGSDRFAYFGQIMTRLSLRQGLGGVIIDGFTRDSAFTSSVDLPIFSKGFCARDIKNRGRVSATDVPLELSQGVRACPGEWVFADRDAVVWVPSKIEREVFRMWEDTVSLERRIHQHVEDNADVDFLLHSYESF